MIRAVDQRWYLRGNEEPFATEVLDEPFSFADELNLPFSLRTSLRSGLLV